MEGDDADVEIGAGGIDDADAADARRRLTSALEAIANLELVRDQLRNEVELLRSSLDEIRAPLDASEAELVAWEAALMRRAEELGAEPRDVPAGSSAGLPRSGWASRSSWRSPIETRKGWHRTRAFEPSGDG